MSLCLRLFEARKDLGRSERPKKGEGFSVLNSGLETAERTLHILLNRVAIFAHLMKRALREFVPSTSWGCGWRLEDHSPTVKFEASIGND